MEIAAFFDILLKKVENGTVNGIHDDICSKCPHFIELLSTFTTKKPTVNVCVFMAVFPGYSWYIQDIESKKYASLATCNYDLIGWIFVMESVETFVCKDLKETSGNSRGLCSALTNGNIWVQKLHHPTYQIQWIRGIGLASWSKGPWFESRLFHGQFYDSIPLFINYVKSTEKGLNFHLKTVEELLKKENQLTHLFFSCKWLEILI